MTKKSNRGFTLVELLSVIVILAIILVIAVPKIMSVITDSKKSSLETSAKMISSSAEKIRMQKELLGVEITGEVDCSEFTKVTSDYASCTVKFDGNTAKVNITGANKFEGMYICNADKNNATATTEGCPKTASETIAELVTTDGEVQHYTVDYDGTTYDAGIRYTGDDPNNYVYFNCDDTTDTSTCETWRIIGVFDVDGEQRVKIINKSSTFTASWDSSASTINSGYGVNQWFKTDSYEGADLYQLLNGFYIGASDTCGYNNTYDQSTLALTCTANSLTSANMKPLTSSAKKLISNATWYTYGVSHDDLGDYVKYSNASEAYLQEMGISKQYTGKECSGHPYCNDSVERTTKDSALIGLMSVSDIGYANGWLYSSPWPWIITPEMHSSYSNVVWNASVSYASSEYVASSAKGIVAATYLNANVQIKSGTGTSLDPYILK